MQFDPNIQFDDNTLTNSSATYAADTGVYTGIIRDAHIRRSSGGAGVVDFGLELNIPNNAQPKKIEASF